MSDKWRVVFILVFAVLCASVGEALAAKGMKHVQQAAGDQGLLAQLGSAARDGHVLAGILLMIGYVGLYAYTLGLADLSFALPLSASSYLLGALFAKFYLHEDVKPARWIGTLIIIAGVLVVGIAGAGGGSSGSGDKGKQ